MQIQFKFNDVPVSEQDRIRTAVEGALSAGEILPCACPVLEAWIYETRPPDFQTSISCHCGLMRPLYSSTPDTD